MHHVQRPVDPVFFFCFIFFKGMKCYPCIQGYTLPETNSSHLKMDGFLAGAMMLVSGSVRSQYNDYDPSKIEWDLTNEPLSKLLELLDTQV